MFIRKHCFMRESQVDQVREKAICDMNNIRFMESNIVLCITRTHTGYTLIYFARSNAKKIQE